MREVAARRALTLLLLLAIAGCGEAHNDPAAGPRGAALRLFELAGGDDATDEQLRALFDVERLEDHRAELLDALARVAGDGRAGNAVVEPMSGPDEVMVDLEVELAGGGAANYSVQLSRTEAGEWRITWFDGPGVEWPGSGGSRDSGLTVSSAPD
jgi:hypothetical protein